MSRLEGLEGPKGSTVAFALGTMMMMSQSPFLNDDIRSTFHDIKNHYMCRNGGARHLDLSSAKLFRDSFTFTEFSNSNPNILRLQ